MSYLKPHDVAVALQLTLDPEAAYRRLAESAGLSQGEVHNAVKRLAQARLVAAGTRTVNRRALLEFLSAGVPYAFAEVPGPETRGVPTAHAAPPLAEEFSDAPAYVWPHVKGKMRGQSIAPLYAAATATVDHNPALYELLALVDAVRVGRARERQRAIQILKTRLAEND